MTHHLEWSAQLDVGVEEMNEQHKELIRRMNLLFDYGDKGDRDQLRAALSDLAEMVAKHFSDEEVYMAKINFPGLATHKHIHESLLKQLGEHAAEIKATGVLTASFSSFLKLWLRAHIMGIDQKYGEHAREHAA